jgi:hypothetical protein
LRFVGGGQEPGKTIAMFGRFAVFALARAGILRFGLLLFAGDFTTFIIVLLRWDCSCCRWAHRPRQSNGNAAYRVRWRSVAPPKFCAALVGTLIKGMGVDHVMWGTDSVWYRSPQWQIEALRRLEIPGDMQKKHGFAPLGDANSATKQLIFSGNATRLYKIKLKAADNTQMPAFSEDRLAALKNEYALADKEPSNLRYGYVRAA